MRWLFVLIVALAGCADRRAPEPATAAQDGITIAVGQPWPRAQAAARRAGYEMHDASQLAVLPPPDGFYIDLPGRRGLLVFRDSRRDVVNSMEWVENWKGPKSFRVYHRVASFDVPPADPAAR